MNVESAARKPVQASATILVASDNFGDAALIKKLLEAEFDRVFVSTNQNLAVEDFESRAPDVLVLAFDRGLVVDDDDFQRKIVSELLAAENYHL